MGSPMHDRPTEAPLPQAKSRLASALRDLASRQSTVDETLQAAVDLCRQLIRGCDVADIMFLQRHLVTTPVSTEPQAILLGRAQQESGEGPCLTAALEEEVVVAQDLRTDRRWPVFGPRALEHGVVSALSYQLFLNRNDGDRFGALNIYGTSPNAFDEEAIELGEVFAAHCSAMLAAAIEQEGAQSALLSRDVIGQAKGILMERRRISADEAFELLKAFSQDKNIPVRHLAEQVATTGDLPD
jgi:hypothetical protein